MAFASLAQIMRSLPLSASQAGQESDQGRPSSHRFLSSLWFSPPLGTTSEWHEAVALCAVGKNYKMETCHDIELGGWGGVATVSRQRKISQFVR
jgi:hypothetical protein